MLRMFLKMTPPTSTAQGKRANHKTGHFFKAKAQIEAEASYDALLLPYQPKEPLTGALAIKIVFIRPYVKSLHLRNKAEAGRTDLIPSVAKPDCGNAAKALVDRMERLRFVEDDKQFASEHVVKLHGPADRVGVSIEIRSFEGVQ